MGERGDLCDELTPRNSVPSEDRGSRTGTGSRLPFEISGNPSAEALVLQAARHGPPNSVAWALEVLGGWRFSLAAAEFEQLMNGPQLSVRLAALRYAAAVRDLSYLDAVRAHVTDPDPGISELAQRTQKLLLEGR